MPNGYVSIHRGPRSFTNSTSPDGHLQKKKKKSVDKWDVRCAIAVALHPYLSESFHARPNLARSSAAVVR